MLIKISGATKTLDIGTFTGYSALAAALALPSNGKVVTCDIDPRHSKMAESAWQEAGVGDRIELKVAPAVDTLEQLIKNDLNQTFDFAFVDADKRNYQKYFELCLKLLKPGSVIVFDDVLWEGKVADVLDSGKQVTALRKFNEYIFNDSRVEVSMLPIGNGATIAHKSV